MAQTELEAGQDVRLKTRGNGPFICESIEPSAGAPLQASGDPVDLVDLRCSGQSEV